MSNSHRAARAPKPAPGTTRRIVGNTLFVGGLVLCGGALVQPAHDAPSVLLTNGTTGGSSGTTQWCVVGTTSQWWFVGHDVQWWVVGHDEWWFVGHDVEWWVVGHVEWWVVGHDVEWWVERDAEWWVVGHDVEGGSSGTTSSGGSSGTTSGDASSGHHEW